MNNDYERSLPGENPSELAERVIEFFEDTEYETEYGGMTRSSGHPVIPGAVSIGERYTDKHEDAAKKPLESMKKSLEPSLAQKVGEIDGEVWVGERKVLVVDSAIEECVYFVLYRKYRDVGVQEEGGGVYTMNLPPSIVSKTNYQKMSIGGRQND